MEGKMLALLLVVSLVATASALTCYQCDIGLNQDNHWCMDPTNKDWLGEQKPTEQLCSPDLDVCAHVVYENNMKRICGKSNVGGQDFCSRGDEGHISCNTCSTDLCNGAKTGGAATMAISTALIATLTSLLFILHK